MNPQALPNKAAITRLVKLIDLMMLDKQGNCKDKAMSLSFFSRCTETREKCIARSGAATEHAESNICLSEAEVSWCYQDFGINFLKNKDNLLPHQERHKRYTIYV